MNTKEQDIFVQARINLDFGANDDFNYYGYDKKRYGKPLLIHEIFELGREFEKIKQKSNAHKKRSRSP